MNRLQRLSSAFLLATTVFLPFSSALAFDPNYIISDEEMTDSYGMDLNQIRAFLSTRGALGSMRLEDHEGRKRWAADIIWYASQNHGINPKVLLVMLQKEQSLIEDEDPTQKQLDWAMGYGVCDDCSMNDPAVQRWQGFGKQINSTALQFTEGYLTDIAAHGYTAGKYGPDITVTIDGEKVTPENAATAALYAYTPHLHGNKNFAYLWQTWFGREYPSGTLMQVPGEEGVYLLQNGYRRPITSESALRSRFNPDLIVQVSKTVLESYPEGDAISFPNYSLLQDENGTIFLLVDDALRPIDSMETFRKIGFSEDEIVSVSNTDRATYDLGDSITLKTIAPEGALYQLSTNGAVFYVQDGIRHPLFDATLLTIRFPGYRLTAATPTEIEQFKEGSPVTLPDGVLVRSPSEPAVYVIADGERLPIASESVFTSYGYAWENVMVIADNVLELHPLGDTLDTAIDDEVQAASVN